MRGENRQGRFSVDFERSSFVSGTTQEIVQTVGTTVAWWPFDQDNSVIDPIYDVGFGYSTGGRRWKTALKVPVLNAHLQQGAIIQSERGLYTTDTLTVTVNVDVVENMINFNGTNATNIRGLSGINTNPDSYLRDRIVFREEVFTPTTIVPTGLVKNKYSIFQITCEQVNPEELVNDPQFKHYANYDSFDLDSFEYKLYNYGQYDYGQYSYGGV